MIYKNSIFGRKITFKHLILISMLASLSACGGGGGGTTVIPTDNTVAGVSLNGTASKGIVKGGTVTAEELNASGDVIATVGSAITSADGSYSLTLNNNYTGGPIQISITADGTTTEMKCDVSSGCGTRTDGLIVGDLNIDFGEWYIPAALTMTALLPDAEANETLSVSVTPFTHMAAALAMAGTTLDAATIANANSEVSNLLGGIDILNTAPVDITDGTAVNAALTKTQVTYAALASALSNQGLTDTNGQPDLNAAIELLANSFTSGVIVADDGAGDDAAQISLQEIVDAALASFTAAGIIDVTGVMASLQSDIDDAVASGNTIDPDPSTTVADANLDKVKAMVNDVRTWGNVISAEVETTGTEFETEINMASDAVDALAVDQGPASALGAAVDAVSQFVDGTNTSANLTDFVTGTGGVQEFTGGTISSTALGVFTITDGLIYGFTVNLTATLPEDGTSAAVFNIGIQSATVTSTDTNMTVNSGTVSMTLASDYEIDYVAMDLGTELPLPKVTDVAFDLDLEFTQSTGLDSLGFSTALDSPVTFAGGLILDFVQVDIIADPAAVNGGFLPSSFELTGSISNATNSMDMLLVMNVTNTGTFEFEGDFAPIGTAYKTIASHPSDMVTWTYTGTNQFNLTSPDFSAQYVWDSSNESVASMETFNGFVSMSTRCCFPDLASFIIQRSTELPPVISAEVNGEGTYVADMSAVGIGILSTSSVDGLLVDPEFITESPTNWIDADIGLTFTAQLTNLPPARVNITADRTGFEAGNATVTISYGNRQLVLSGSISVVGGVDVQTGRSLTITNQDNVVLIIDVSDGALLSGSLSYNGVEYGTLTETSSGYLKITYIDGTFEIS